MRSAFRVSLPSTSFDMTDGDSLQTREIAIGSIGA
jgi:hypothetical protein